MEVGEGELIRRKILNTLKTRGDYMSMVTLCEKAKIAREAVPSILHALIGRGHVKKKQDDSGYGYALTHAGTLAYKKILKEIKEEAENGKS